MKKILPFAGATLLFTVLGLLANKPISEFFISKINLHGFSLVSNQVGGQFAQNIWYTAAVALLPALFALGTVISKVKGLRPNLLIGVLILACGIISAHFRTTFLSQKFEGLSQATPDEITNAMDVSNLLIGQFLLIGLFIGAVAGGYAVRMVAGNESDENA